MPILMEILVLNANFPSSLTSIQAHVNHVQLIEPSLLSIGNVNILIHLIILTLKLKIFSTMENIQIYKVESKKKNLTIHQ